MARILLVEDDPRIGSLVQESLHAEGHHVAWSMTGRDALNQARQAPPDVILLDLGLPDVDGVEVCRRLRLEQPDVLIMMLTARSADMDVIAGLESGADDYVTKPFGMTVLSARVAAHLRRIPAHLNAATVTDGDLTIDPAGRRCLVGGLEVSLRTKQFDLLQRLGRDLGRVVPRAQLMADVWESQWTGSTKTLDVHVATLRQRLAAAAAAAADRAGHPMLMPQITTVRNIGYRLDGHLAARPQPGLPGRPGAPDLPG